MILFLSIISAFLIENELNYINRSKKRIERSKKALIDDRPKYFN